MALAFVAALALNFVRLRRAFAPLRKFATQMEQVDLRHPERARVGGSTDSLELEAFTDAFNAMLERLADEQRAGSRAALLPRSESGCVLPALFTMRPARP